MDWSPGRSERNLRFALIGAGFWARFQLAAWREVPGVECAAICDTNADRARSLAAQLNPSVSVYDDPQLLLEREQLDFVDIVSSADSHAALVCLAASQGLPAICQKPMANSYDDCLRMTRACEQRGTALLIHENWRWQSPIRKLKSMLDEGGIGQPFRARLRMVSGFPVFENQPALKDLTQFVLMDMGPHILDVARFLFGEARTLYCVTQRVQRDIRGEDVATVTLRMQSGAAVVCEFGYPGAPMAIDHFPQTLAYVEGSAGTLEILPDYQLRQVTRQGAVTVDAIPPRYDWADPAYDLVHASIVACHENLLAGLRGEGIAETRAEDNLKSMRLVFQSYESARRGEVIHL